MKASWTEAFLIVMVFGLFAFVVWTLRSSPIPEANRDAFNQILGILYAAVTGILGYCFGSSAGSRSKDQTIQTLKERA